MVIKNKRSNHCPFAFIAIRSKVVFRKWNERKSKLISFEEKFEQKLPKLLFSKEKAMHFFCFYKYFLLVYPIKLLEFFGKLSQSIISFLITMKNLKSEFFMNIIHMQKWRVTIVYVAILRLDQDKKACSVTTVYDGSIVYVVLVISNHVMTRAYIIWLYKQKEAGR